MIEILHLKISGSKSPTQAKYWVFSGLKSLNMNDINYDHASSN